MSRDPAAQNGSLSQEDLRRFSEFFYTRTGMVYAENKRFYVERRISERMRSIGATTFASYMAVLRSDAHEIENLINAFTVNETYYFREDSHLSCLSKSLLPEIARTRRPGDQIRILSLPCSTGEEPYSIAIWLLENWANVDVYNIEIVGCDIDTRALAEATNAIYSARALSRLPADLVDRYFTKIREGEWQLILDLRESVKFAQANLVDERSLRPQGLFDVIFCRNVLIYFDDTARLSATDNLAKMLNPGGYVCLGYAETMVKVTDRLEATRIDGALVYRRPV